MSSVYISNATQAADAGHAVWHKVKREWIFDFVLLEDEKRVRLDIHDDMCNYQVMDVSGERAVPLENWTYDYT